MSVDILQSVDLSQRSDVTYDALPEHIREGARRYIEDGVIPGKFLRSALTNDFVGTCIRADHMTAPSLVDVAKWLFNDIPGPAWGSQDAVAAWSAGGGLRGKARKDLEEITGSGSARECAATPAREPYG